MNNNENGQNFGINDSNITIEDTGNNILTSTNSNNTIKTTQPLIQLNLFQEVSVDQRKKMGQRIYKKWLYC